MKPAKTIKPQGWMKAKETRKVMEALGGGDYARFVGGSVRSALLGVEVEDIDIATLWTPDEVTEKLQDAGIKVVPTGIEHGTVTAVENHRGFEVTTLRKDVETDGRRAVVAFSKDWAEDAQRRDFTMNTLLADEKGNVYDPTGQGLADLEAGRVVFVGDPAARIREDYLRVLRFFRFHALYGKGEPDAEALKQCNLAAQKMNLLSKERITQEFFKIMAVDAPMDVLDLMFQNNVLKRFLYSEYDPGFLKNFCEFQLRYGLGQLASRLFVLAGLEMKNIKKLEQFLFFPRVFRKDIEAMSEILALPDLSDDHAVKVAVYKYGRMPTAQALMIELVQDRVMNGYAPKALKIIQKWDVPDFPVSGNDLMKRGIEQGPELGRKLAELEEEWIAGGFR